MFGFLSSILLYIYRLCFPFAREDGISVEKFSKRNARGKFVRLSGGKTRYYLTDPTNLKPKKNRELPLIVLVHGMSLPMEVYLNNDFVTNFESQNYQVLCYDIYGRGYSATPKGSYNGDFYVRQLRELLHKLQLGDREKILVAASMGGLIISRYFAKYGNENRIMKMVFLCSAGFNKIPRGLNFVYYIPNCLVNVIAHFLFKRLYYVIRKDARYHRNVTEWFFDNNAGMSRALIMTLKNFMYKKKELVAALKEIVVPVFCVWAKNDLTMPTEISAKKYGRYILDCRTVILDDVDHNTAIENEKTVNLVVDFVKED